MEKKYIGYVSSPFGAKKGKDFDSLYTEGIFPAPNAAIGNSKVILFREDGSKPPWHTHHIARIERFRGRYQTDEWQLRQSIQDNIIGSDFLIAVLTDFNPNVMLEVGFAQAHKKIIIYVLIKEQFKKMPANLAGLKRLYLYDSHENLKLNIYLRIQEILGDLDKQYFNLNEHGGFFLEYYPKRDSIGLVNKFQNAKERIQILTTNLTTVSANYIDAIVSAVTTTNKVNVKILTSDPENEFIDPRANQLQEDKSGYRMELRGSLDSIKAKLHKYDNCRVRTYKDFPVQLWHLIDDRIYLGQSSLLRRTRHNCAFGIGVDTEGIKETYLDHFDRLWEKAGKDANKTVAIT